MKHFGDITKLHGGELPWVDVITGGSPCQDLSVAGKRAGMLHESNGDEVTTRSGLFYDQIRIIKEMRDSYVQKGTGGSDQLVRPARYSIWENVPGALSAGKEKGEAFQAVLTEFVRIVEPDAPPVPMPAKGRWPSAGCLYDPLGRWSVAWRVHDLQYWGCPQRRKRVCVLCDFDGPTAPWILFDPQFRREAEDPPTEQTESDPGAEPRSEVQPLSEGLCGHSGESGAEGQGTAGGTESGSGGASYTLKVRGGVEVDSNGRKAGKGALVQTELSGTLGVSQDQTLIQPCLNPWDVQSKHVQSEDGVAEALYSGECRYGGGESYVMAVDVYNQSASEEVTKTLNSRATDSDHTPCVVAVDVYNQSIDGEVAAALTAAAGGTNTSGPKVMCAGFKPRQSAQARNVGYEAEKSPTVLTDVNAAVLCLNDQGGAQMSISEERTDTLRAQTKHHEPIVYRGDSITSPINASNPHPGDPSHTLTDDDRNYLVYENHSQDSRYKDLGEVSETVSAKYGTGGNNQPLVLENNRDHGTVTDDGVVNTLPAAMGMGGGYVPMLVDEPMAFTNRGYDKESVGLTDALRSERHGAQPCVLSVDEKMGQTYVHEDLGNTLSARDYKQPQAVVYGIDQQGGKGGANYAEGVCPAVLSDSHGTPHAVAYGISSFDSNAMKSPNPHSGIYKADSARTLDLNGGSPACNQGGVMILNPSDSQGNQIADDDGVYPTLRGCGGAGYQQGYCLAKTEPVPIEGNGQRESHRGDGYGMYIVNEENGVECMQNGFYQATGDQAPSLLSRDYKDPPIVKKPRSVVRRLTPKECERLQGFDDNWTDIGDWTDSKGKVHKGDADSPRYKALGNSIGLPFWQWLAERICAQYPADHQVTLGSLFDGIGGFPCVFERCGGKAVWASEIEEFPIAVTKKHFPEEE